MVLLLAVAWGIRALGVALDRRTELGLLGESMAGPIVGTGGCDIPLIHRADGHCGACAPERSAGGAS